jgi:hypothetical protein
VAGAGLAFGVLVPAAERGLDLAGADAGAAGAVQAGEDGAADVAGQVAGGAGSSASSTGGFLIAGEGKPPRDQIVTNLPQSGWLYIFLSLRTPPESRANRTGDRPTVLVKAVLNALADP